MCMEDALPMVGEQSSLRSFRSHVLEVTRQKLRCLRVILSNESITPPEPWNRRSVLGYLILLEMRGKA